jgi:tRNA(Ile)-lysidine synthetase, N-terminal domain
MATAKDMVTGTPRGELKAITLAVKRYLEKYSPKNVLIGVSGGPDSVALATAVLALANRPPVYALTVDHQLRLGSADEAQNTANLMEELGAKQAWVTAVKVRGGEGPARDARLEALEAAAQKLDGNVDILLGHTMDDQAETVLLRLARGASTAALAAMKERRSTLSDPEVFIGRPLLNVRRADTKLFCEALGLKTVADPTNHVDGPWQGKDGNPLRRAAVRDVALPTLSQALVQDVVPALARIASQAGEDEEVLRGLVPDGLDKIEKFPRAIRMRAYRSAALRAGVPDGALTHIHLDEMDLLITNWHGQGPVHLPRGVRAWREAGQLYVKPSARYGTLDPED